MTETVSRQVPGLPSGASLENVGLEPRQLSDTIRSAAATYRSGADAAHASMTARFRAAADAHAHLVTALRTAVDGQGRTQWVGVTTYAHGLARDVIGCIVEEGPTDVAAATASWFEQILHDAETRIAAVPELVHLGEAPEPFAAAAGDSPWRRVRKMATRLRRRLTAAGRTRAVPLKQLVAYHMRYRLPGHLASLVDRTHGMLASQMAALEQAITAVTSEVLRVDADLDRATYHHDTVADDEPADDYDVEAFLSAVDRLQSILTDCTVATPDDAMVGSDDLHAQFVADLDRSGTYLLPERTRVVADPEVAVANVRARTERWARWFAVFANRLVLSGELLTLRRDVADLHDALLDRTWSVTGARLRALVDEVGQHLDRAREILDAQAIAAETIERVKEETLAFVRERRKGSPHQDIRAVLDEPGAEEWERVTARLAELPDGLALHTPRALESPSQRTDDTYELDLQKAARDAIAPPFPDQLRKTAAGLSERFKIIWRDLDQIEQIVAYNLSSAAEELAGDASESDETGAGRAATARELATSGLRRAGETLEDLLASADPAWLAFVERVYDTFAEDWEDLQRRLESTGKVEEKFVGIQTRLARRVEASFGRIKAVAQSGVGRGQRLSKRAVRRAMQLLARGQQAVGVTAAEAGERLATLDAVANASQLAEGFPLVYRKLFTRTPVKSAAELEGRGRDLIRIRRHFERWKAGQPATALLLVGQPGIGRTSVLNVLGESIFASEAVRRIDLTTRMTDEQTLADALATTLGAPGAGGSLLTLERHLTQRSNQGSRVCLVDDLEHTLALGMRQSHTFERLLMFFARTDAVVFWVATINDVAWQFVQRTLGPAAGFVTTYDLAGFDRDGVEAIVKGRHERSGMALVFEKPKGASPLLAQKLRRARTEKRRSALLETYFFDRLYREAGSDIALALFYWLRSTRVEDEVAYNRGLTDLEFGFLGDLELSVNFMLRAFVFHKTLTLGELMGALRLPEEEATFGLEQLLNLRLIEPVSPASEERLDRGIEIEQRYRLRSLLVRPIREHLKAQNLVY